MRSPTLRAALALLLLSAWMGLLFAGAAGGGAVHLLLVAAGVLFPWRARAMPQDVETSQPATVNRPKATTGASNVSPP